MQVITKISYDKNIHFLRNDNYFLDYLTNQCWQVPLGHISGSPRPHMVEKGTFQQLEILVAHKNENEKLDCICLKSLRF